MTLKEFQSKVIRLNYFDKYQLYLLGIASVFGGLYFLRDVINHSSKYSQHGLIYFTYPLAFIFILVGIFVPFFIKKRYRVLTYNSKLDSINKLKIIEKLSRMFDSNLHFYETDFCSILYDIRKWYSAGFRIYISFDENAFYASVHPEFGLHGGIVDFVGAATVRKKWSQYMNQIAQDE